MTSRPTPRTPGYALALALLLAAVTAGCGARPTADVIRIDAGRYDAAFDAAVEAARARGLVPSLRDRRGGIIETDARIAPSLLEPGGTDHASFDERLQHTIAMERIRARFEFVPAGPGEPAAAPPSGAVASPDLLALGRTPVDLTKVDEPLELRVWAFVEQSHVPGLRLTTWTRADTTVMQIVAPDGTVEPGTFWTPVGRNRPYERRLLAAVARDLDQASEASTPTAPDDR